MAEETFDQLYGGKGVDTAYEREKLTYRPVLNYSRQDLNEIIRPEVKQSIERARTFTISQNLSEYDELIAEIDQMLKDLEARNATSPMSTLKQLLTAKNFKGVIDFERGVSSYDATGDFELYSLLYNMRASCIVRRDFLDERFRSQLTSETAIEEIQAAEEKSISEWEQLEAKVLASYKEVTSVGHDHEDHPLQDTTLAVSNQELTYDVLLKLEKQKRNKELLHVSLADTSYIHRNRYFLFLEIIQKARVLVYHANSLIDYDLGDFIRSLQGMGTFDAPKSHLILSFRKVKEKHEGLKGRMMTIEDQKGSFASEKQYLYQQLEVKTVEPIKSWMYEQEEGTSGALDMFSQYMMDSLKESRKSYDGTNADMLNFYKSEADFYDQQIHFLKNKEEIRKFLRIIEDLGEASDIQGDWVQEYLKTNGYSV